MDLTSYRTSPSEQARVADLMRLAPERGRVALDIGARDGFLSRLLADRFERVIALDLEAPVVDHPRVEAIKGDASKLIYASNSFDLVLCAEVLEHIPPALLPLVCNEISRVAAHTVVIGVPYRQDLRFGRTVCAACRAKNPPWGHVNAFDKGRLFDLFGNLVPAEVAFVGTTDAGTNSLSASLMDYAGNPFGTYEQEEGCVCCGAPLQAPAFRTFSQKVATRIASTINKLQRRLTPDRGNWLHVKFEKKSEPRSLHGS